MLEPFECELNNDASTLIAVCYIFFSVFIIPVHSSQYNSEIFIKSDNYAEQRILISTLFSKSNLGCVTFCVQNEKCSMIIVASTESQEKYYKCLSYKIPSTNNKKNLNISNRVQLEVWYKLETYPKLLAADLLTTAPVITCSAPFVNVGSGCYYIDIVTTVHWNEGLVNCHSYGPDIALAGFDSVTVSIFLYIIQQQVKNCIPSF